MHPFEEKLSRDWPPRQWSDFALLVAVSGGPDSVALLRALLALGRPDRIVAGHFHQGLRGADADADQQFVAELAGRWGLAFETARADPQTCQATPDGVEAAARELRYRFLRGVAERRGLRYLATGHTADDQIETVLHRVLRGTGLAGLAGIPRVRRLSPAVTLMRPLLKVRRQEALEYLDDLEQPYRVDHTNLELEFTRNRLRNDLLPRLEQEYNPRVGDALLRLSRLAGEAQAALDAIVEQLAMRAVRRNSIAASSLANATEVAIDCEFLVAQPRHVVRELFVWIWREERWSEQAMGLDEWDRLAGLAVGPAGAPAEMLPGAIRAERRGRTMVLRSSSPKGSPS